MGGIRFVQPLCREEKGGSSMKEIYKELEQLKLVHIFYGHLIVSLLIGSALICLLLWQGLPYYIPVVVYKMYYVPLERMKMRLFLYVCRIRIENLPLEQMVDAAEYEYFGWKLEYSQCLRVKWVYRFAFTFYVASSWAAVHVLLPQADSVHSWVLILGIVAAGVIQAVFFSVLEHRWLEDEIKTGNGELLNES